jgi:hypothetical protein
MRSTMPGDYPAGDWSSVAYRSMDANSSSAVNGLDTKASKPLHRQAARPDEQNERTERDDGEHPQVRRPEAGRKPTPAWR